jgi:starch-binding outer membrane protein, SusD/RagB family
MKKLNYKIFALSSIVLLTALYSCKKLLDKSPAGVLAGSTLANKAGVDGLLIGAYSLLDGYYSGQPYTNYGSGISNWPFGGIGSDDAYKGSTTVDQAPDAPAIEQHATMATTNSYVESKWQVNYTGIQRANNVIQEVPLVTDGSEAVNVSIQNGAATITTTLGDQAIAEARFLRGVYHFELAKIWKNVPYVDETITYAAGNYNVSNVNVAIWTKIEADFTAAMAKLPNTQAQAGRANYYAAEAFLAKAFVYDHKYSSALPLLNDLIANGETANGQHYKLDIYPNNFNASTKNGPESVFAAQMTVNDGSNGQNDDAGDVLNFPGGGTYTTCCGFYIPSYNLANSFQVDVNGLPMFQPGANAWPKYDDVQLPSDHGIAATSPFTPTNVAVDPRLDWTVGRRGIPYLDWGLGGGEPWTRGDLAPYTPKKNVFYEAAVASTTDNFGTWATNQGSADNYDIIRFADVILWRAEAEVNAGSLAAAMADVNLIRARAANPVNWVYQYADVTKPQGGYSTTPAANYHVGLYTSFPTATYAYEAILMERELEFGMEGQRFFDLQRLDGSTGGPLGTGYMAGVLNAYYAADTRIPNPVLSLAKFTAGRDEIYPIPQIEIDAESGALKQNPNY